LSAAEVRPVAEDRWSLRVTLDGAAKADLDALRTLLSHKIPDGELGAVVREAIRCALEKHGKRRGADLGAEGKAASKVTKKQGSGDARPASVRVGPSPPRSAAKSGGATAGGARSSVPTVTGARAGGSSSSITSIPSRSVAGRHRPPPT
jgi:hypothetical protein